jgi:hypothetical protein
MKVGDKAIIEYFPGIKVEVVIVDDCYRQTDNRCTMLVRLNHSPDTEIEINVEDVLPYGQDI